MDRDTLPPAAVARYLGRIGVEPPAAADRMELARLHAAHLEAVPFENLDIALCPRPIELDLETLFDKIVVRRRGGFCYELNLLFAALLRSLGYAVSIVSARVRTADGGFGPEFDHMALVVDLEERWLADVGYGDGFREPLLLEPGRLQEQRLGAYRLLRTGDAWSMEFRQPGGGFRTEYLFSLGPHRPAEFLPMCAYHQTSPDSPFTRGLVCSRATPEGRVTIANGRLIRTAGGVRRETPIDGDRELARLLREHFGIELPELPPGPETAAP